MGRDISRREHVTWAATVAWHVAHPSTGSLVASLASFVCSAARGSIPSSEGWGAAARELVCFRVTLPPYPGMGAARPRALVTKDSHSSTILWIEAGAAIAYRCKMGKPPLTLFRH